MAMKERAALPSKGKIGHEKYAFGLSICRDMLIWLKGLALDPCNMKSSNHRFRNRVLKIHRVLNMSDAKTPQRKRKFMEYLNDGKIVAAFGLSREEKSNNQNDTNRRRGRSSSLSCSPSCIEKGYNLQEKEGNVALLALNDIEDCGISRQDYPLLSDFDESIKGTNPLIKLNLKSYCKDLVNSNSYNHSTQASIKKKLIKFSLSNNGSNHHLPRPVIPIGPRFQAEVPKWKDPSPTNQGLHNNDDDLKWLGSQIWPVLDTKETNNKACGKGRPKSCSLKLEVW